jgi:hypothetical protein
VVEGDGRVAACLPLKGLAAQSPRQGQSFLALYDERLYAGRQSLSATAWASEAMRGKGLELILCADQAFQGPDAYPSHGYGFSLRVGEGACLFKYVSGTPQLLGRSRGAAPAQWGHFTLNAVRAGTLLQLSVDGRLLASVSDASFKSGRVGFRLVGGGGASDAVASLDYDAERSLDARPALFAAKAWRCILEPSLPWERKAVFEPSPIQDGQGFLMSYTGGWNQTALGLARSADGIHWSKLGKALGLGAGGEDGSACRSNLMRWGDGYRLYYSDGEGNIRLAESKDGRRFRRRAQVVIAHDAVEGVTQWHNQGYLRVGAAWWALVEGRYPQGAQWRLNLFRSDDEASTFHLVSGPVSSLQVGYGVYCSPRALFKVAGGYELWYHVSDAALPLPTVLWHAHSDDLIHWTPDPYRSLGIAGFGLGLPQPDQLADPAMLSVAGRTLLFYDADDNPVEEARIGVAARPGGLADLLSAYPQWTQP